MRLLLAFFIAGCFLFGGCCGSKETMGNDKMIDKSKSEADTAFQQLEQEKGKFE